MHTPRILGWHNTCLTHKRRPQKLCQGPQKYGQNLQGRNMFDRRLAMKKATWLAVVIFLGAISSFADDVPQGDVAAAYSFVHFGPGSNANGGSFSAAVNANRWFGIAGDFGAYSQSQ